MTKGTNHFIDVIFEGSFPQDAGAVGLSGDEGDAGEGEVVEGGDAVLLGDLAEPHVPRVGTACDWVLCLREKQVINVMSILSQILNLYNQ